MGLMIDKHYSESFLSCEPVYKWKQKFWSSLMARSDAQHSRCPVVLVIGIIIRKVF